MQVERNLARRLARARCACVVTLILTLAGCGDMAKLPVEAGTGPTPELPAPTNALIPTVNVAAAKGWPEGLMPAPVAGTVVTAFARDLDHPRWIHVLPNGDVLVAESNAPPKPDDGKGVKAWFMKLFMKRAGAASASANRITLLRDADGDGVAELRFAFLEGLNSPFGMVLVGQDLYVADSDAIRRFPYVEGATRVTNSGAKVVDLPAGPLNHHWTKNVIASRDGRLLYVTVGSNSNVGENGLDKEEGRAAIWEVDPRTGAHRIFASGLRNPNGMGWEPRTGALWTVVNERDELGSDLVPDYFTSVVDGGFYGWPYSYFGKHVDTRVVPPRPDLVERARVPDYALGPHTASLGLVFVEARGAPTFLPEGAIIGQHGSWNRNPRSGYKVIFVPFHDGKPAGPPRDVLTGFLAADGGAYGRPVGVALDTRGGLLVADDVGNAIWRVSAGHLASASPGRR